MVRFNSHEYITKELNPIFLKLKSDIETGKVRAWIRHQNTQLLDDDWRNDLVIDLDRRFDELSKKASLETPKEIFTWTQEIADSLESYGPYYWEDAETFFFDICSTKLLKYMSESEAKTLMAKHEKRWTDYIKNLRRESEAVVKELDDLGKEKTKLDASVRNLQQRVTEEEKNLKVAAEKREIELAKIENKHHKELQKINEEREKIQKELQNDLQSINAEKNKIERELNSIKKRNKIASIIDKISSKIVAK